MQDEFALKYYGKLYIDLSLWEQRHIDNQIDAAMSHLITNQLKYNIMTALLVFVLILVIAVIIMKINDY